MRTSIILVVGSLVTGTGGFCQQVPSPTSGAIPTTSRSQTTTYKIVANFHDVLTHCIQTGCTNIDDLVSFFADDGARTVVGGEVEQGRAAIRSGYLKRGDKLPDVSYVLQGVDVSGPLVVCRVDRMTASSRGRYTLIETRHDVHVILLKDGLISQFVVMPGPKED